MIASDQDIDPYNLDSYGHKKVIRRSAEFVILSRCCGSTHPSVAGERLRDDGGHHKQKRSHGNCITKHDGSRLMSKTNGIAVHAREGNVCQVARYTVLRGVIFCA